MTSGGRRVPSGGRGRTQRMPAGTHDTAVVSVFALSAAPPFLGHRRRASERPRTRRRDSAGGGENDDTTHRDRAARQTGMRAETAPQAPPAAAAGPAHAVGSSFSAVLTLAAPTLLH